MKALCGKKALLYRDGVKEKKDELKIASKTYINISAEREPTRINEKQEAAQKRWEAGNKNAREDVGVAYEAN
ncbi:hypothetical protein K0M31_012205 [Melipona bicolor]|uniref:Uncharacterized protein n=1 Tax=Melipona bicolor TaxID=60889 RepID=A0AA40FKP5_9HYME|nr:hypothetical protein K0M31_012205 [Melipona bicolor]